MGRFDAFFEKLEEERKAHHPRHVDPSELIDLSRVSISEAWAPDVRVSTVMYGPDDGWEQAPLAGPEERAAEELRAADEAASALSASPIGLAVPCPLHADLRAIEVELVDDTGPCENIRIELSRAAPSGVLAARTNRQGWVRFEGLRPSESYEIAVLGVSTWSIQSSTALPDDRAISGYEAAWAPPPEKNASGTYALEEGECLWTVAVERGLDQDALWKANADLHREGRDANILAPGDEVKIEAAEPKAEPVKVAQKVRIKCKLAKARARVRFQDDGGKGRAGIDYVAIITTAGGACSSWKGKTDGDGAIDEPVPSRARTLEIILATKPDRECYQFRFADLDPIETVAGVQGRLFNLGFWCGPERGTVGPLTTRALLEFQKKYSLSESGEIDAATRSKLTELHGS